MTVSVTKNLAPHVQTLADFREAEKLAAAEVERCKGELKTAKAIWEERVADLNRAVDDLIDKEREPTLFDSVEGSEGGDASGDGGANPDPSGTPPGGGGNGEVMDAEVVTTIVPTGLAPSEPVPLSLPAAAVSAGEGSAEPPTWHRMTLTEAFVADIHHVAARQLHEPGEVKGDDAIGYFADHFEFIGEATSSTGYRSHYQNFDKKHPRPGDVSLAEWSREFAESLYVEREQEKKKRATRGEGKKSDGKKATKGKGGKKVAA